MPRLFCGCKNQYTGVVAMTAEKTSDSSTELPQLDRSEAYVRAMRKTLVRPDFEEFTETLDD